MVVRRKDPINLNYNLKLFLLAIRVVISGSRQNVLTLVNCGDNNERPLLFQCKTNLNL